MTAANVGEAERLSVRDELILLHMPLVDHIARKYSRRGEPLEDLVQVGMIGLVKATDRFDPDRGVEFSTYATPTVLGEIKRYFRDKCWSVRVSRRLQELRMAIAHASEGLTQRNGHAPTVSELATALGVTSDEIIEGLEAAGAYSTVSLDPPDNGDETPYVSALLGVTDPGLEAVEDRESLRPLLATLSVRDRAILRMRFFQSMTQSEIAAVLGISQMHVSRLLARTLTQLHARLLVEE